MSDRYIYNIHVCVWNIVTVHSYIVETHRPSRRGDIPFLFSLRTSQLGTNSGNDSLGEEWSLRFNNLLSSGRSLKGNLIKKAVCRGLVNWKMFARMSNHQLWRGFSFIFFIPNRDEDFAYQPSAQSMPSYRQATHSPRHHPWDHAMCVDPVLPASCPEFPQCYMLHGQWGYAGAYPEWHSNLWKCRQVGGWTNPFEKNTQNGSLPQVGIKIKRNFHPQSRIPPRYLGLAIHTGTAHATGKLLTGSHQGKKDDHYWRDCYYYYYYYYCYQY